MGHSYTQFNKAVCGSPGDQALSANGILSFPHQHQVSASEVLELTLVLALV